MSDDEHRELATVTHLPLEQQVYEGEIVDPDEVERIRAHARMQAYRHDVVVVGQAVRTVATSSPVKAVVRNLVYIPAGFVVAFRRRRDSHGTARHERMMRIAEAAGDLALVAEWETRAEQAKRARHQRTMNWAEMPARLVKSALWGVGGLFGVLLLLGIVLAIADRRLSLVGAPLLAAFTLVKWLVTAVTVAWFPIVLAIPWLIILWLWSLGRQEATPPAWLATAADADMDLVIDETTIANALAALRIPQITDYLRKGLPLQYITTARRDGRGTFAELRLPAGVPADMIARRRAALSTGLHRLAKEVWPTTGSEEGILKLWIADKGALAEGAGPYPLLTDGLADVFKGVPFGRTLRGDPVMIPLMGRNTITGGQPGQGKSSAARITMLGANLDPTAELRIWIPDANYDFEAFRPRCSRYVMGAESEKIEQILFDLRELHAEVQHRGELLIQHQEPEVTRKLADANVGLHPLFCLLEEAHVAFNHKDHGDEISELFVEIVRLGRKRGIHMLPSTQAPTKTSIPRDVTRNCTNGLAFAVGDHVANDALLGQGAYAAGHRATELIPGTDIGTCVAKGLSDGRSEIVQVYFVSVARGNDEATPIIERGLAAIAERGNSVPGTATPRPQRPEARDLLDDLDQVLGEETVPCADLPALLARLAPDWAPYRALTGKSLRELLRRNYGVKVPSTGNRWPVSPQLIAEALERRSS